MEDESINILEHFLFPWIIQDPRKSDYGIDLEVIIAEINQPISPEHFHIQLKSQKKIQISNNRISYPMPTKSLQTYEQMYDPVYIVLCDLNTKKLYWVNAQEEICRLNIKNPDWRDQKSNTIYFHLPNTEFSREILKKDVIETRKRLIIKNSIKIREEDSSSQIIYELEIQTLRENIISGKIEINEPIQKDLVLADLSLLYSYSLNPEEKQKFIDNLKETINLYNNIIDSHEIDDSILLSQIYNTIGVLLFNLSKFEDEKNNIESSIQSVLKAKQSLNTHENPFFNFIIHNNLGVLYQDLYKIEPQLEYAKKIIDCFSQLLDIKTIELPNEIRHFIGIGLAEGYVKLAKYENFGVNIKKSIQICEKIIQDVQFKKYSEYRAKIYITLCKLCILLIDVNYEIRKKTEDISENKRFALLSIKYSKLALNYFVINKNSHGIWISKYLLAKNYFILAQIENPIKNIKYAIKLLKNTLLFLKNEKNQELIAECEMNLGVYYRFLLIHEVKKEYFENSIKLLNSSLKVWELRKTPMEYANSNHNLGKLLSARGLIESSKSDLNLAIEHFNNALRGYLLINNSERIASIYFDISDCYAKLADMGINRLQNYEFAINFLKMSLDFYTFNDFPYHYATIYLNLGTNYLAFYIEKNERKYLNLALESNNEALQVFTPQNYPSDYGKIQFNLGSYYKLLASLENKKENLEKAINCYGESIKYRTLKSDPIRFGKGNLEIGETYIELLRIEEKQEYFEEAIKAFLMAERVYDKRRYEQLYIHGQIKLVFLYNGLSKFTDFDINFKKLIGVLEILVEYYLLKKDQKNFGEFLELLIKIYIIYASNKHNSKIYENSITKLTRFLKLAEKLNDYESKMKLLNSLGVILRRLADIENKEQNLKNAINYFEKALISKNFDSKDYPIIEYNLGSTSFELYKLNKDRVILEKAKNAYDESLKYINKDEFSEAHQNMLNDLKVINLEMTKPKSD